MPIAAVLVLVLTGGGAGWFILTRPGPGPRRLAATSVSGRSVTLTWSRPAEGTPQRYVVYRNGIEITRTGTGRSHTDLGLSPLTVYRYRVRAVVDGRLSYPTTDLVVHTPPLSPRGLTKGAVTTTTAVVSWSAPEGAAPDRYIVRRDGGDLATVPATTLTYRDTSLLPLAKVSYAVVAVTRGRRSAPSPLLQVTTPAPALESARLQDSWNVLATVTKPGRTLLKAGDASGETWVFSPTCAAGACPVRVSATLSGRPFTLLLKRSGAVYRGSGRAQIARCLDTAVNNTVTLSLRVAAGGVNGREWVVSDWTASLKLSIPYTRVGNYYCPSQSATFTVAPEGTIPTPHL